MAKKQMTLGLINMFIHEVNQMFRPLIDEVNARESGIKIEADIEARKELGIYELTMKKAKLKLELEETERQLKVFTERRYGSRHSSASIYEEKVNEIIARLRAKNPVLREIEEARDAVIRDVRIAALGDDMKLILTSVVPEVLDKLTAKLKALPAPAEMKELPEID